MKSTKDEVILRRGLSKNNLVTSQPALALSSGEAELHEMAKVAGGTFALRWRGVRRYVGGRAVLVSAVVVSHSTVPVQRVSEDPLPTKKSKPKNTRRDQQQLALTNSPAHTKKDKIGFFTTAAEGRSVCFR